MSAEMGIVLFVGFIIVFIICAIIHHQYKYAIIDFFNDLRNPKSDVRIWIRYYRGTCSKTESRYIKIKIDTKNSIKNYLKSPKKNPVFKERLAHAMERAESRYKVKLDPKEMAIMVALIQNNKAKFIERRSRTASLWDVGYGNQVYRVMYDSNLKMLSTFYPDPNPRLQTVISKEKMREIKQFLNIQEESRELRYVANSTERRYNWWKFWKPEQQPI